MTNITPLPTPSDDAVLEGRIHADLENRAREVASLRFIILQNVDALGERLYNARGFCLDNELENALDDIRRALQVNLTALEGHVKDLRDNYTTRMRWKDSSILALKQELNESQLMLQHEVDAQLRIQSLREQRDHDARFKEEIENTARRLYIIDHVLFYIAGTATGAILTAVSEYIWHFI